MCAQHRLNVLGEIRKKRMNGKRIIVVSTSLVEAGVDIDFPVVYREAAGLDSIAQAAGRCNREGALASPGKTILFRSDSKLPGYVVQPASITQELLSGEETPDLTSPEIHKRYFLQRYWTLGHQRLDEDNIMDCFRPPGNFEFSYHTAAERFWFIKKPNEYSVVVPYNEAFRLVDEMSDKKWEQRKYLRKLQRFIVDLYEHMFWVLCENHAIREIDGCPGPFRLIQVDLYDKNTGLISPEAAGECDPESLCV